MLITGEELARGAFLITFGSMAGGAAMAYPASMLWLVPAAIGIGGCVMTEPAVRQEVVKALPELQQRFQALPLPAGMGVRMRRDPLALSTKQGQHAPALQQQSGLAEAQPLRDALHDKPHRFIIGRSRGGKTSLMHALAAEWQAAGTKVFVLDPDHAPGMWPGCVVAGGGDDFEGIERALQRVKREIGKRRQLRTEQGYRTNDFRPMHLIIDEAHDVFSFCESAVPVVDDLARRGAKLNMHLTVGTHDGQVGSVHFEGKSKLFINFTVAEVMKRGEQRLLYIRSSPLRAADSDPRYDIPVLPDPESLIVRRADHPRRSTPTPSTPSTPTPDDLLRELLQQGVSTALQRQSHAPDVPVSVTNHEDTDTGTGTPGAGVSNAAETRVTRAGSTIRIDVHASAESHPSPPPSTRRRRRRGHSVNVSRLRQRADEKRVQAGKDQLRTAYEQRKAAGASYRSAYRELGGGSEETRTWWRAAPGPAPNDGQPE